jgi:hypothetical protein
MDRRYYKEALENMKRMSDLEIHMARNDSSKNMLSREQIETGLRDGLLTSDEYNYIYRRYLAGIEAFENSEEMRKRSEAVTRMQAAAAAAARQSSSPKIFEELVGSERFGMLLYCDEQVHHLARPFPTFDFVQRFIGLLNNPLVDKNLFGTKQCKCILENFWSLPFDPTGEYVDFRTKCEECIKAEPVLIAGEEAVRKVPKIKHFGRLLPEEVTEVRNKMAAADAVHKFDMFLCDELVQCLQGCTEQNFESVRRGIYFFIFEEPVFPILDSLLAVADNPDFVNFIRTLDLSQWDIAQLRREAFERNEARRNREEREALGMSVSPADLAAGPAGPAGQVDDYNVYDDELAAIAGVSLDDDETLAGSSPLRLFHNSPPSAAAVTAAPLPRPPPPPPPPPPPLSPQEEAARIRTRYLHTLGLPGGQSLTSSPVRPSRPPLTDLQPKPGALGGRRNRTKNNRNNKKRVKTRKYSRRGKYSRRRKYSRRILKK